MSFKCNKACQVFFAKQMSNDMDISEIDKY